MEIRMMRNRSPAPDPHPGLAVSWRDHRLHDWVGETVDPETITRLICLPGKEQVV